MQKRRQSRYRAPWGAALIFAVSAFALQERPALAEAAVRPATDEELARFRPFAGTFQYEGPLDQGRAIVRRAFEEAIEQAPPFLRPMLTKRMNTRDYLVQTVSVSLGRDRVGFRAQNYRSWFVSTRLGEERSLRSKQGKVTLVMQRVRNDGRFEQVIRNRRGRMENVYTLEDDGQTLVVETTITSPLLERPVSLELRYRRDPPPARRRPPVQHHRFRQRPARRITPQARQSLRPLAPGRVDGGRRPPTQDSP